MSLRDVVLDVAERMEVDSKSDAKKTDWRSLLRCYAAELRGAARVSSDVVSIQAGQGRLPTPEEQAVFDRKMIEAEKEKLRAGKGGDPPLLREESEPRMVQAEGGVLDGTLVPVPQSMPINAKCEPIVGSVYVLQDGGRLVWSLEESKKLNAGRIRV